MKFSQCYKPVAVPAAFASAPGRWLADQAKPGMVYLLAHADDGVVWGKVSGEIKDGKLENKSLALADEIFPDVAEVNVPLRGITLQQARLFGPAGELYIWRIGENTYAARIILDGEAEPVDSITDHQWLWGTLGDKGETAKGFTLLVEGDQGMRHAPPIDDLRKTDRVMLMVRHYVDYDSENQAYIAGSRLTDLKRVED